MDAMRAARYSDIASALEAVPADQPGRTLDLIARMLDYTDGRVCDLTGGRISRATINAKRKLRTPVRADDLWPLSDALDIDLDVLLLRPAEAAAWLVKHRPHLLDAGSGPDGPGVLGGLSPRGRCTEPILNDPFWSASMVMLRAA